MAARSSAHPVDCGCCAGLDAQTPRRIHNAPGREAIEYRTGTYARFRESLLARLSSSEFPALAGLGTRRDEDVTIALCDALAVSLDVLTFYQERLANEHYLRTATERVSVLEMAELIGYRPAPGVAASSHLAFRLQEAPGGGQAAGPIRVPVGTRVQSVPGQDETPQSFETVAEVQARVEWNAMAVQTSEPWRPARGDTDLHLAGVSTGLAVGDAILIVGATRGEEDAGSERWDVRVLDAVETDTARECTRVAWSDPLGHAGPTIQPASRNVRVFAFRRRASLFGHNAPDPRLMSPTETQLATMTTGTGSAMAWSNYQLGSDIDLDAAYPGVTADSWVALVSNEPGMGSPSLPGYVELYRAARVSQLSRTGFGLSARITRVHPDTSENLWRFDLDRTLVLAESEELPTVGRPVQHPVYGLRLALGSLVEGLEPGQALALTGLRQRLRVAPDVHHLTFTDEAGRAVPLAEGDSLLLVGAPARWIAGRAVYLNPATFGALLGTSSAWLELTIEDRDGTRGTLRARAEELESGPALEADEPVSEVVHVAQAEDAVTQDRDRTRLRLGSALQHVYRRDTLRLNANVAPATHGETVAETLGSGDARLTDVAFELAQGPLTYVSAATPSGRASTLDVRVNDLAWEEVASLHGRGPEERVHGLRVEDGGGTRVRFGDGISGARLPSGQNNVRATYRKGLGVQGNLPAGVLTNLLSRPLGVAEVTNPVPASGGEDAESLSDARGNAPLTVLTLDRAVSVQDYADFARAFAGIRKAHALWVPAGPARGVFLTVAGVEGTAVPEGGETHAHLKQALADYGDPLVPLLLENHRPAGFRARLMLKVDSDHLQDDVLSAVQALFEDTFQFERRAFGQGVSQDELAALAHQVPGVVAAHVVHLYADEPGASPTLTLRLRAELPVVSLAGPPSPAALLTLTHLDLEVMP